MTVVFTTTELGLAFAALAIAFQVEDDSDLLHNGTPPRIHLALQPHAGKTLAYMLVEHSECDSAEQPSTQTTRLDIALRVESVDKHLIALRCVFTGLKCDNSEEHFDSVTDDLRHGVPIHSLAALLHRPFTVKMKPNGEVVLIELEDFRSRLMAGLPGQEWNELTGESLTTWVRNKVTSALLERYLLAVIPRYPIADTGLGARWRITQWSDWTKGIEWELTCLGEPDIRMDMRSTSGLSTSEFIDSLVFFTRSTLIGSTVTADGTAVLDRSTGLFKAASLVRRSTATLQYNSETRTVGDEEMYSLVSVSVPPNIRWD
ncbi:MAG: hypothetical protein U1E76_09175 [Planctomycetota bacterium]